MGSFLLGHGRGTPCFSKTLMTIQVAFLLWNQYHISSRYVVMLPRHINFVRAVLWIVIIYYFGTARCFVFCCFKSYTGTEPWNFLVVPHIKGFSHSMETKFYNTIPTDPSSLPSTGANNAGFSITLTGFPLMRRRQLPSALLYRTRRPL